MRKCSVGGQAVMEGVMMKSDVGMALAVRKGDGTIVTEYKNVKSKAQKGTFFGLPIVRGVVAFVESLTVGMGTLSRSAELYGEEMQEEPTKFEKFLAEKLGKSVDKVVMGIAVVLAVILAVGLFFILPTLVSSLVIGKAEVAAIWKSLLEGVVRVIIFIGYILAVSFVKDVRRVFMYHGAEHKTIACYEAEEEMTPANAMKHTRLHPRCGTNYMFLVMAVSILFFAVVGWGNNVLTRVLTRIIFLPIVAGLSYEVLKLAAKSDNIIARIVRAPGLALQRITTKEPTEDMIEVAIAAFNLAMEGAEPCACTEESKEETETASEAPAEEAPTEEEPAKEAE